ncbi:replication protein A 70 kDa DNA-binding subunit D-like [Forsythia ovata]|uniref:Replication protein A 70 kDa DNA-binding subunit D-like n=1 Tax=Forsythia ovata TaxID=205694 RepID=A0ABD1S4S0_9LAMI
MAIISDIVAVVIDVLPKKVVQTKYQSESCIQELILMNEKSIRDDSSYSMGRIRCQPVHSHLCHSHYFSSYFSNKCESIVIQWVDDSIEIFETITSSKSYLTSRSKSIAHPPAEMIVPIEDVPRLLTEKDQLFVWMRANLRIINNYQPFWCMCCNVCNKISNVGFGKVYQCIYCKYNRAKGTPRAMVHVQLQDYTGYINATMIGDTAELFLQCSGEKLMEIQKTANEDLLNHIRTSTTEEHILYVKAMNNSRRCTSLKYDVIFMLNPMLDTSTCSNPTDKPSSSVTLQISDTDCASINRKSDEQIDLTVLSLENSNTSQQAEKQPRHKISKNIGFHEAKDFILLPTIAEDNTAHF